MEKMLLSVGEFKDVQCFSEHLSSLLNLLQAKQGLGQQGQTVPQDDGVWWIEQSVRHEQGLRGHDVLVHVSRGEGSFLGLLGYLYHEVVGLRAETQPRLERRQDVRGRAVFLGEQGSINTFI